MAISTKERDEILDKAQNWFRDTISENHIKNTIKLADPKKFNINPFLSTYLANFLTGNSNKESIAKALVYPRVLGTSITTSFGTNIQKFTNDVLNSFGSTTSGIDIEFKDQIDGRYKYCQLKSGPNTINKDDVETIAGHFKSVINLGRTNNLGISHDQMIVGLIYGDESEINGHYRRLSSDYHYPVHTGKHFWHRLTGEEDFYFDLTQAIGKVAIEANYAEELEKVVKKLAKQL